MTQEDIENQLLWNEIHKKYRIKENFRYKFKFKIPNILIDKILELKTTKNKIEEIINEMIEKKLISQKDERNLQKYID